MAGETVKATVHLDLAEYELLCGFFQKKFIALLKKGDASIPYSRKFKIGSGDELSIVVSPVVTSGSKIIKDQ